MSVREGVNDYISETVTKHCIGAEGNRTCQSKVRDGGGL